MTTRTLDIAVGPLNVRFATDSPHQITWEQIEREFHSVALAEAHGRVDLLVHLHQQRGILDFEATRFAGRMAFAESSYQAHDSEFSYVAKDVFTPGVTELRVAATHANLGNPRAMAMAIRRSLWSARFGVENRISSYSLIWYVIALALHDVGAAFVHAGVVQRAQEAIVFAGTGGSGKTSLAMNMMERPGSRFLAEDFGVISTQGIAAFSPKSVTIYASDVMHGQTDLVQCIRSLSLPERLRWSLHRLAGRNPRLKVPPCDIFRGSRLGVAAPIGKGYFLVRAAVPKVRLHRVSLSDFVRRVTSASFRELSALYEVTCQGRALGMSCPSMHDLECRHEEVVHDAFRHSETFVAEVPRKSGPQALAELIP